MTNQLPDPKSCENCKFFSQHYAKGQTGYIMVRCGHCKNPKVSYRKKWNQQVCDLWETAALVKEERKKSIKLALEFMLTRLTEISSILSDDKEENISRFPTDR